MSVQAAAEGLHAAFVRGGGWGKMGTHRGKKKKKSLPSISLNELLM